MFVVTNTPGSPVPLYTVPLKYPYPAGIAANGERQYDNAGGSRKLSAGHSMRVKERHYEKVGEDFEQAHESYRNYHPAFVEGW